MEVKTNNNLDFNKEIETIQGYEWRFETEKSIFTGTCLSLDQVKKEINMLTEETVNLKKYIVPVDLNNKNFKNKFNSWSLDINNVDSYSLYANLEKGQKLVRTFKTIEALIAAL